MRIKQPGSLNANIDMLGEYASCIYLLRGDHAMIIGGGMTWVIPKLEKQLSEIALVPEKLKYIVILHSHFDHCGAVPYLKQKFPHVKVLASSYAQKVLAKDNVTDFIAHANRLMVDNMRLKEHYPSLDLEFQKVNIDHIVREGDLIDLGDGLEVNFIEVPGHTQCSIAVYVPQLEALFPSDAAPFPVDDTAGFAYPSPQHSFTLYLESLRKMATKDIEIYASEHHGAFVGDQAKNALKQGIRRAEQFQARIIELYSQTGDAEKVAKQISKEVQKLNKIEFMGLDPAVMRNSVESEVRNVLSHAGVTTEQHNS